MMNCSSGLSVYNKAPAKLASHASLFLFIGCFLLFALHKLFSRYSARVFHTFLENFFRVIDIKRISGFFRHAISLQSLDVKIARFYRLSKEVQKTYYRQNLQNSFLISSFEALRAYKDRMTLTSTYVKYLCSQHY